MRQMELEIRPLFLVPDTNGFIDHLASLAQLLESRKYILVVPLIGESGQSTPARVLQPPLHTCPMALGPGSQRAPLCVYDRICREVGYAWGKENCLIIRAVRIIMADPWLKLLEQMDSCVPATRGCMSPALVFILIKLAVKQQSWFPLLVNTQPWQITAVLLGGLAGRLGGF